MTVASNKRKNMKHLHEMNDYDFVMWLRGCRQTHFEMSWKLDGFFLRFGKDADDRPFFQTARSPVLYDPMEIIWFAIGKGYDHEAMTRAENYFHLIKTIWASKLMTYLEPDSCFECEVFDKAASTLDKETGLRTFVNVAYDDAFFIRDITLFIYNLKVASTGLTWVNGYKGLVHLDDKIHSLGSRFDMKLDMEYFRECAEKFSDAELCALKSLKHADRELKLTTKQHTAVLKDQFRYYVLNSAALQTVLGKNFEGVVMTVNNIEFKLTTDYFKEIISGWI